MNKVIHKIILDMKSIISQQTIDIQRYDTGRKLAITLTDDGRVYQIAPGCRAVFTASKPDGAILFNECLIVGNTIEFDLAINPQVSNVVGEVKCEIRLYGADGTLITSPCFSILVDKTVYTDGDVIDSSSEFSALSKVIADANEVIQGANEAIANAESVVSKSVVDAETKVNNAVSNANTAVSKAASDAEKAVEEAVADAEKDITAAVADMRSIVDDSANAFLGNVRGPVVSVSDVSPIEHTAKVRVNSKNLIARPYHSPSQTTNGVTFVINDDGSVTVNGTATAKVVFYFQSYNTKIKLTKGESYVLSGCPGTGSSSTYMLQGTDSAIYYTDVGVGKSFVAKNEDFYFYIVVYEGFSANNLVFKPQLELGTEATEFAPYIDPSTVTLFVSGESGEEVSYTPNADGAVDGVKSIYPIMNLRTDTENVIIEAEYNRDSNVVLKELLGLMAQGGLATSVARIVDVSIYANKWVGTKSPYSQVVEVEGATEYSQVDLTPSVEQLSVFYNKSLAFVTENVDGVVTVYAIGQKPTNDYTIQATVKEVKI